MTFSVTKVPHLLENTEIKPLRGGPERNGKHHENSVPKPELAGLLESCWILGFLEPHEKQLMDEAEGSYGKHYVPMNWACQLCHEMKTQGKIAADVLLVNLLGEIMRFRTKLEALVKYDWVSLHRYRIMRLNFLSC